MFALASANATRLTRRLNYDSDKPRIPIAFRGRGVAERHGQGRGFRAPLVGSIRRETMWFAPEIGRWVERESVGTYYLDDSVDDTSLNESSYRWKLSEWT
jgi:hypothetical protein